MKIILSDRGTRCYKLIYSAKYDSFHKYFLSAMLEETLGVCMVTGRDNKWESEMAQEELIPEQVLFMEALPLFLKACSQPHPMLVAGNTKICRTPVTLSVIIEKSPCSHQRPSCLFVPWVLSFLHLSLALL